MSRRTTYAVVAGIAVVLAGILIAVSVLGGGDSKSTPSVTVVGSDTAALLSGIPERGPVLGRADAPVTLVEFADPQCPFCAQWSQSAFPEIVRDYVRPGKVRIVFRGLMFIGPDSEKALRFVYAAGLQRKLWSAIDLLYANQGEENSGWVTDEYLAGVAAAIPVFSLEQALADSTSAQVDTQIRIAADAADSLEVSSTPSFAAGKTGGELELVAVTSLTADALRPTLDSLLAK
jgi:protein-disulfide isomerase